MRATPLPGQRLTTAAIDVLQAPPMAGPRPRAVQPQPSPSNSDGGGNPNLRQAPRSGSAPPPRGSIINILA